MNNKRKSSLPTIKEAHAEERKKSMKNRSRNTLYMIAGFYLVYLAYQMYHQLGEAGDQKALFILCTVLFAVIGVGIAGMGMRNLYRDSKMPDPEEIEEDDGAKEENSGESEADSESGAADSECEEESSAGEENWEELTDEK